MFESAYFVIFICICHIFVVPLYIRLRKEHCNTTCTGEAERATLRSDPRGITGAKKHKSGKDVSPFLSIGATPYRFFISQMLESDVHFTCSKL